MMYRNLLSCFILALFAQLYPVNIEAQHRFTDPDNEWSVLYSDIFSPNVTTVRYRFGGDSVLIGDLYYYIMEENREETGDSWQATTKYYREDSGTVYTYDSGEEYEVYDFNLNVPDSFKLEILGGPEFYMLTRDVDEITLLDQVTRKKLTMSCYSDPENWNHYWVEGIGDIDLGPFGASCLFDINSQLLCFHYQGNLVYTSDFGYCFRTNTKDIIQDHDVKIYPNPANQRIFIQTELQFNEISILNPIGKVVFNSGQWSDGIDVSHLPQGVYYVKLSNSENKFATLTFSKL